MLNQISGCCKRSFCSCIGRCARSVYIVSLRVNLDEDPPYTGADGFVSLDARRLCNPTRLPAAAAPETANTAPA